MSARRILTVGDLAFQFVMFTRQDGSAQAVIGKPGKEPTIFEISAPPEGQFLKVTRLTGGTVEVVYDDVE